VPPGYVEYDGGVFRSAAAVAASEARERRRRGVVDTRAQTGVAPAAAGNAGQPPAPVAAASAASIVAAVASPATAAESVQALAGPGPLLQQQEPQPQSGVQRTRTTSSGSGASQALVSASFPDRPPGAELTRRWPSDDSEADGASSAPRVLAADLPDIDAGTDTADAGGTADSAALPAAPAAAAAVELFTASLGSDEPPQVEGKGPHEGADVDASRV